MVVRRKSSQLSPHSLSWTSGLPARTALISGLCLGLTVVPTQDSESEENENPPTSRKVALTPEFANPFNPFELVDVGRESAPAFADLDGDRDMDLLVGESTENFAYFENTGTTNAPAFAPKQTNPFGLEKVSLQRHPTFADLDGDQDLDLLVGEVNGNFIYYENTGTTNAPAFAPSQSNPFGLRDIGTYSSPAIADLDGDGDLDILSGQFGNLIYFENTGQTDMPRFILRPTSPFGLQFLDRHSSPTFIDLDGDDDFDLLVGDREGNSIYYENTGATNAPAFSAGQTNPFGMHDIGHRNRPAIADLDGDGDFDVLSGRFLGNLIYFENTGATNSPAFLLPSIDLSRFENVFEGRHYTFVDLDADGDLDLFSGSAAGDPHLKFWENTGTANSPVFAPQISNPFGLDSRRTGSHPAFADLDGDGDFDLLTGDAFGTLFYFENTGSANSPAFADRITGAFGLDDWVPRHSAPAFADLDLDGDFDLMVGVQDGHLIYFRNMGTASSPMFNSGNWRNPFGLSNVGSFSRPTMGDLDNDGDIDLITGDGDGNFIYFENTAPPVNLSKMSGDPAFAIPLTNPFGLSYPGTGSAPVLVDLDGDRDLDVFLGNSIDTAVYFQNNAIVAGLPVELTLFTASIEEGIPILTWQTASEIQNAGFEVQHAPGTRQDDHPFEVLTFIEGHGTTLEAQHYQYRAEELAPGHHRFRLKQIDFDGGFEIHPEIELVLEVPGTHGVSPAYPNPFNDWAQFSIIVSVPQVVQVSVYDVQGRLVDVLFKEELSANRVRYVELSGAAWPSGMYVYVVEGMNFRASGTVMLQK